MHDFSGVDRVYDTLLETGMRPVVELSYMPHDLATDPSRTVFAYEAIISPPRDWDRWADLPRISAPTLFIGARHDTMNPADIEKMGELVPRSRVEICPDGSHLAMWDDQDAYFRGLLKFVRDVEAGKLKSPKARASGSRRSRPARRAR